MNEKINALIRFFRGWIFHHRILLDIKRSLRSGGSVSLYKNGILVERYKSKYRLGCFRADRHGLYAYGMNQRPVWTTIIQGKVLYVIAYGGNSK